MTTARPQGTAWLRDDRYSFVLAGAMWILIVLMIVPEGFDYQRLTTTGAPSSGSAISRILWLGLLTLSASLIVWRAGLAWLLTAMLNPFLLWASLSWAVHRPFMPFAI